MTTIFEKIIAGEIPGQFVYEDEVCVAFLDAFPAVPGQTLVVPREAIDYFADLPPETLAHLTTVAQRISQALDKTYDTVRTCLVIEGFEVPHVHLKLYPMTDNSTSLGDVLQRPERAEDGALEVEAAKIKAALKAIQG